LDTARQRHKDERARCLARHEKEVRDAETAHAERLRELGEARNDKSRALLQRWESGAAALLATFAALQRIGGAAASHESWVRSQEASTTTDLQPLTPELPFGTLTIDVPQLAGETDAARLAPLPAQTMQVPAFLPFPRLGGLLRSRRSRRSCCAS
jgi:hypothetical protein